MRRKILIASVVACLGGCVVLPEDAAPTKECYLSSNKKYLKVVDLTEGDPSFYRWNGKIVGVITMPTTAVLSASYVAINNVFHFGEELIKCDGESTD